MRVEMPLRVELYGCHVGDLHDNRKGTVFVAATESHGDSPRISASFSMEQRGHIRKGASNFFNSLLPQGDNLKNIARQKQLSEKDSYGLLKALGRDVAGAVQIFDPQDPYEQPEPFLENVSSSDVRSMLHSTYSEPLGNTPMTGMMSLGGYQNKIMLVQDGSGWNRAHNGHPTTHIIKPHSDHEQLRDIIYCEDYGLGIARAAGVLDYSSWIEDFDGEDALVIERFDRSANGKFTRIHQENALQALGLSDNAKYEMHNHGVISLKHFAKLLRSHAGKKAQLELLGTTVVNTAIGNLDAHAGNLGVLHLPDGSIELAPAYDMVVNTHYLLGGGDQPMALLVGGEYKHKYVSRKTLIAEGVSWGIREPQVVAAVDEKLDLLREAFETVEPHPSMPEEAYDNVGNYIENLLNGKPVGAAKTMSVAAPTASPKLPAPSGQKTKAAGALCGAPVKSAANAPCILKSLHGGRCRSR